MMEFRNSGVAVVTVDDAKAHRIRTDLVPYNVVDEYRTRWIPGVFAKSLETRKPPMCWAHQWEEPIGHLVDFNDNKDRLQTLHELDNFDDVPRARQAWSQFQSGTLTDASFGFSRAGPESTRVASDMEGVEDMVECRLDEASPVLIGAVPGAKMVGTRGIPADTVMQMARSLEANEMTLDAALALVRTLGGSEGTRAAHSHAKQDGSGQMTHSHAGDGSMHAHSGLMPAVMGRAATGGLQGASTVETEDDTVACPKCGAMNEEDALFCDQCGASMAGATNGGRGTMLESEARSLLAEIGNHR